MIVGIVLVLAVLIGVAVAAIHGDSRSARWGRRRGRDVHVGASPYREGRSAPFVTNSAPSGLRVVAGVNAFWGALTGLVFAPAGCLVVLFAANELKLLVLPLLVVECSGFGLAFGLGVAAARTLRRRDLASVRKILTWSMVHHAGVLVVMGLASIMMDEVVLLAMSVVPCLLGMTFAHLLAQGVERIELGGYEGLDDSAEAYS